MIHVEISRQDDHYVAATDEALPVEAELRASSIQSEGEALFRLATALEYILGIDGTKHATSTNEVIEAHHEDH